MFQAKMNDIRVQYAHCPSHQCLFLHWPTTIMLLCCWIDKRQWNKNFIHELNNDKHPSIKLTHLLLWLSGKSRRKTNAHKHNVGQLIQNKKQIINSSDYKLLRPMMIHSFYYLVFCCFKWNYYHFEVIFSSFDLTNDHSYDGRRKYCRLRYFLLPFLSFLCAFLFFFSHFIQ